MVRNAWCQVLMISQCFCGTRSLRRSPLLVWRDTSNSLMKCYSPLIPDSLLVLHSTSLSNYGMEKLEGEPHIFICLFHFYLKLKLIKVACNECKKCNWCIIFLDYFHGSVVYVEYPTVIFMKRNISRLCLFPVLCSSSPLGQCISFGQPFFLITKDM